MLTFEHGTLVIEIVISLALVAFFLGLDVNFFLDDTLSFEIPFFSSPLRKKCRTLARRSSKFTHIRQHLASQGKRRFVFVEQEAPT
jgi:hypothetical protein